MRTVRTSTPTALLTLLAALSLGGCFSPDLGPNPFLCASSGKPCPDGYSCQARNNLQVCVQDGVATGDASVAKAEHRVLTDAELLPSKEGPVYLDGAPVKSSTSCLDKDVEPNNTSATATPLPGQGYIPNWEICYAGDVDHYAIQLQQGQKLVVKVVFYNSKGDLDAALLDPDGYVIEASRGTKDNELITLNAADKTGKYILGVYGFGAAVNTYDLDVSISK